MIESIPQLLLAETEDLVQLAVYAVVILIVLVAQVFKWLQRKVAAQQEDARRRVRDGDHSDLPERVVRVPDATTGLLDPLAQVLAEVARQARAVGPRPAAHRQPRRRPVEGIPVARMVAPPPSEGASEMDPADRPDLVVTAVPVVSGARAPRRWQEDTGAAFHAQLGHLSPLQRSWMYLEILGPPRALRWTTAAGRVGRAR